MKRMNAFISLSLPSLEKHAIQQAMNKTGETPV